MQNDPNSPSLFYELPGNGSTAGRTLGNFHEALAAQTKGCIYQLEFPDGMKYVGKSEDFVRRMRFHRKGYGGARKVEEWRKKYGWDRVKVTVLKRVSNELLNTWEIAMIEEKGTLARWVELDCGGDGSDSQTVKESWENDVTRARRVQSIGMRQNGEAGQHQSGRKRDVPGAEARKRHGKASNAKRSATEIKRGGGCTAASKEPKLRISCARTGKALRRKRQRTAS